MLEHNANASRSPGKPIHDALIQESKPVTPAGLSTVEHEYGTTLRRVKMPGIDPVPLHEGGRVVGEVVDGLLEPALLKLLNRSVNLAEGTVLNDEGAVVRGGCAQPPEVHALGERPDPT